MSVVLALFYYRLCPLSVRVFFLKRLREWTGTPVIILSMREHDNDKIKVLDAGADDYVTKPFGIGELLARIRVVLRYKGKNENRPALSLWRINTRYHTPKPVGQRKGNKAGPNRIQDFEMPCPAHWSHGDSQRALPCHPGAQLPDRYPLSQNLHCSSPAKDRRKSKSSPITSSQNRWWGSDLQSLISNAALLGAIS